MRQIPAIFAFNRGRVSPLALGRVDQKRVALSAETMTNWIPRVLGPMSLRPGFQYLTGIYNNAAVRLLDFVFSTTDTAILELTDSAMRVLVNETPIVRPTVTTAVTNGTFDTDLTGWTDNDESGATSAWVTGGYMGLTGNGTAAAIRDQSVTVGANANIEHALRIVINRGPVTLQVGSSAGTDNYISETTLATGVHSLAFTPTGDFNIRLSSTVNRQVLVDSCTIESAGAMVLPTPWTASDLTNIRPDQSADVVFVACSGMQQRRIERRATRSWSIVPYLAEDGPFRTENTGPITLTASDISGNITLTASASLFRSGHVGAIFSITSDGQQVEKSVTAENTFSNPVRITGVGTDRGFTIVLTNTFVATVVLQRSLESDTGPWEDVGGESWTANTTEVYTDGLDNQIAYYRVGVKTGGFTSGQVDISLSVQIGSITGIARVTGYTNATSVSAEVLVDLGGTVATDIWSEGEWSDYRGWPTAVALHEGRLWWFGKGKIWGSISDAYDSFDPNFEGDAGPLNRSIGSGPVDTINWAMSLQRLIIGGQGTEYSLRSSSLDEPLTPTNFNIKTASTQGSGAVPPVKVDQRGIYVQRGGIKVYEMTSDGNSYDYTSNQLTQLVPEMGLPGIVRIGVQRQPDTRIHAVRSDGTVMLGVYDKTEDVLAWVDIETLGSIEDVVVLPGLAGSTEDRVYYVVRRTIDGSTVRYLEKWALETECRGDALNKQADSFVTYSGVATSTISGLSHLEGEEVVVWADGADVGTDDSETTWTQLYSVSGGVVTLDTAASNVVVGLPYSAQWKSAKLGAQDGTVQTVLNQQKRLSHLGFVMAWVHAKGVRFGPDFDHLDDLPEIERGTTVDSTTVRETYDEQEQEFPSTWVTDLRLCLQAAAPRPVTMLAVAVDLEIHN